MLVADSTFEEPLRLDVARAVLVTGVTRARILSDAVFGERTMKDFTRDELVAPPIVDRSTVETELDAVRVREKAHTWCRIPNGGL
jgi:hypothetical protein